jgi:ubiquinone/menaquinone biosynthesis C-methylase UbiE
MQMLIYIIFSLFSIPELVTQQKSIEKHILQIGCYDATWAMEVAVKFPKWIVIGLDVNYYHTTRSSNSPRNFKFIKCLDLLQQLSNFPDQTFDFIESRFLMTSYSFDQYQLILNECIRITKPGGYIEVMEMDLRIYHQRLVSSSVTHLLNNEGKPINR